LPFYHSYFLTYESSEGVFIRLTPEQIQELAKDILFGQLRLVIATMTIEEINSDINS
jgi:uncharacterized membrane protein YqiK